MPSTADSPAVSFYLLPSRTEAERLLFACKLAEKAYRNGQFSFIVTEDDEQLRTLDDLLWTFRPGSFVPHQIYTGPATPPSRQVLLSTLRVIPEELSKIIINLSANGPENFADCERILEILDADEAIKAKGRTRYKRYQQAGLPITTHPM